MRRRLAALAVASTLLSAGAAAAACSSSSGSTDDGSGDSGAPETGIGDAPGLDEIQPPIDSGAKDPSFDDFEDPGQCGDWLGADAMLLWRPGGAHMSMGACKLCPTDAGGTMYKLVVVPPGSYALEALLSREDGGAGDASWTESLAFAAMDGNDAGYFAGSGALGFAYASAQTSGASVDGVRVLLRLGMTGGTDPCMLVDDVRLRAQ